MINIYHVKYFYDALRLGSLTASAKANKVTLSAVSQAIAALEEALGTPLLVHGKNKLAATPQGLLLCEKSVDVFASIEKMLLDVADADVGMAGHIRIAASHSLCNTILPDFLHRYQSRFPKVSLSLFTGDAATVRELILARRIDVGLVVETRWGGRRKPDALVSGSFVFVSHRKSSDKEGLGECLILGDKGEEVLALKESLRKSKVLQKMRLMHIQSWEVIANLAAARLGIGYVPDFLVTGKKDLRAADLGVSCSSYDIVLHCADTAEHSRSVQGFVNELKAHTSIGHC